MIATCDSMFIFPNLLFYLTDPTSSVEYEEGKVEKCRDK